jgi:NAD(P)-dependent dehydrogenase (short-subunit alcohol dehydrogenase family)
VKPVCLITGAGGRLGKELTRVLVDRFEVIAAYRNSVPEVESQLRWRIDSRSASRGTGSPETPYCIQADLNNREDIRRLVEVSLARYGRIDAIVNSAADCKAHGKLIELWEMDGYAGAQLSLNCIAPIQLVSAVHQACWKDRSDENARWNRSVVNISSIAGLYAYPGSPQAFYSASKAALNILTLYLSLELEPYRVRANAVCPAPFSDLPSTLRVVESVRGLLEGTSTGTILSSGSGSDFGPGEG